MNELQNVAGEVFRIVGSKTQKSYLEGCITSEDDLETAYAINRLYDVVLRCELGRIAKKDILHVEFLKPKSAEIEPVQWLR